MNAVIINVATGRYFKGQERLRNTINQFSKVPFLCWQSETQLGAPLHKYNPYAFKIYAFYKALSMGYDTIIWLDASCYLIKDIYPILEEVHDNGYIMQEAGHFVGRWSNDYALDYFGVHRAEANQMLMYGNAGFLGLSAHSEIAMTFLDEWRKSMEYGCFKGEWSNHRHDMTCGSIIANNLGMKYKSGNEFLAYASPQESVNETIIIKAQGL